MICCKIGKECGKGGESVDIQEVRGDLAERFPLWSERIRLLRFQSSDAVTLTDNDGAVIYYNDGAMTRRSRESRCFYMARQLLHLQLAHHARRGDRDLLVWKRACDAVVDAMLRDEGFQVPTDAALLRGGATLSAEEMYEVLLARAESEALSDAPPETEDDPALQVVHSKAEEGGTQEISLDDPGLAAAVAGLAEMLEPSMQVDFDWFPGGTIRDGLLRYDFKPYPVARAEILLDTSASVDAALLRWFVRAVKALMRQDAVVRVGCFDTRFYGFQDVYTEEDIEHLALQGSGGTDFTVAINAFTGDAENQIIFTDGYAEMPEQTCHAVWVVYGTMPIHPKGGRVIYVRPSEEKEKYEVDFLIT